MSLRQLHTFCSCIIINRCTNGDFFSTYMFFSRGYPAAGNGCKFIRERDEYSKWVVRSF